MIWETAIVEWFVAVGVSKNQGYHFEGHHIKGYSILKSILGPVSLWKLSCSDPYKYIHIYIRKDPKQSVLGEGGRINWKLT